MKKCLVLLSLTASLSVFARPQTMIFPNVFNQGSSVTVSVWNYSDRSVSCSGTIYMDMESGTRTTESFFDYVMARFTSYRTIYPRMMNDRIRSVSHSISCF